MSTESNVVPPVPAPKPSFAKRVQAFVANVEKSKTGAQVLRFVRLAVVGVVTAYVSHSALDTAGVVTVVETAFRQVFPASH